jgi:hypothetical protein
MKIFNKLCMLFFGLLAMSSLNAQTELIKGGTFKSSDISQWTLGVNANGQSGSAAFGNTVNLPTGSVSTTSVKLTHNGVGMPEVQLYQRVRLLAGQVYKLSAKVNVSGVMSNRALQVYVAKDSTPDNGTMFSDAIMNTGLRTKSVALFLEGWPFAGNAGTVSLNGAFPISTVGPGTDLIAPDESGDYLVLIKMGQWGPFENYPDRKTGAKTGFYTSTVKDMEEAYLLPQDYGLRTENRWVRLENQDGYGLEFKGDKWFDFAAQSFDTDNLTRAKYPFQLQRANGITLNFNYETSGVGCTATSVLNQYRVIPKSTFFNLTIRPYHKKQ